MHTHFTIGVDADCSWADAPPVPSPSRRLAAGCRGCGDLVCTSILSRIRIGVVYARPGRVNAVATLIARALPDWEMEPVNADSSIDVSRGQAGAIPCRRRRGRLEFCLVTTSRGSKWGFPKGIIDPGETPVQTAHKEAREEAGLHGTILGEPVGSFQQTKWGLTFRVHMFFMEVTRVDKQWDEQAVRRRRWCDAEKAQALLKGRPVGPVFADALQRLEACPPKIDDGL